VPYAASEDSLGELRREARLLEDEELAWLEWRRRHAGTELADARARWARDERMSVLLGGLAVDMAENDRARRTAVECRLAEIRGEIAAASSEEEERCAAAAGRVTTGNREGRE
jgi:hypothetical protein